MRTSHFQMILRVTLPNSSSLRDIAYGLRFRAGGVTVFRSPILRSRHGNEAAWVANPMGQ